MKTECRSCRAPIEWKKTLSGKSIPLDLEPVPDGNIVLTDGDVAETLGPLELELLDPDRARYVSHFATCPDADQWRGGGR